MKRLILLLMLLPFFATKMRADFHAPEFNFLHYTTENGLPSNCVRDIVQDSDGFMWFATDGGLVRFDGLATRVFTPLMDDGLERDIFIMSVCRYGEKLLVGTDHRVYVYNPEMECLAPLEVKYPESIGERISGTVHDISADSNGNIWVSVGGKGVFRVSKEGEATGYFAFPEVQNYIGMVYVDSNDSVWCVSNVDYGGVYRYDRNVGKFMPFVITIDGVREPLGGMAISSDSHGDYWLGTWNKGLVKFNGRTGEGKKMMTENASVGALHVHAVTQYSPTMLLVGSDSGLTLVDMNTGESKVYGYDELNAESLNDKFVYKAVVDSEGGLWVGTYYRGVNYLRPGSQRFRRWDPSRFANSVSGNVVVRLCEDNSGFIWIGTADGGLCRYDPENQVFRSYPLSGSRDPENVNALCADGNKIWVGTYTKGAGVLDASTGSWHRIPVDGETYSSCYAIHKDSKGRIWMAATEWLAKYNPEKDLFERICNLKAWINDIDEDRDGNLWICTQGKGLFRYDPETGTYENYRATGEPDALPHDHVNGVKIDNENVVYVATTYGVYVYDRAGNIFKRVNNSNERCIVHSIEKSGDDLWFSTMSGLVNLKPDGYSRTYTRLDGLSDNQFIPGASLHASDGKIYYGTIHGFCMVDPMEVRSKGKAPVIKFTGLDIVNSNVSVGDPRLPSSLNSIDRLVLTHADHTFSVYFSALSYANPGGNTYRYRLEGFDKAWHDAGKENRATYSNLPPGTYTLRVKAANSDGVWNEEGIALKIEVKPAWYASALMKALYVILGAALLLLGVRYTLWRMERHHIVELDRISSNKEKEMYRSKLSFFTVVAHEIRTPVSLIIGPLEKILESSEKFSPAVKDDLHVIDRNARRLLSLVNQLLDFKRVEDNALPVGFRHEKIVPLVESVVERFRPSVEHNGGTLTTDFPDKDLTVDVDPEAVTKLVSNLLNNARKFTKDSIHVECRLLPGGHQFMISVADNGIGIKKENRDKIFKPFFQILDNINESKGGTGLGLSIVKSVADAHGGTINVESTPGKGSKFIAVLPVSHENVVPAEEPIESSGDDAAMLHHHEEPDPGAKPALLVVDDNEEMVKFISSSFESNYDVVTASDGKEALKRMSERSVSLIICDWMMPVMDGVEFLKAVRKDENYSHIPFVMLTAKTDNVSKIETMRFGADAYVEKPFSIGFLEARIENLLEMRSMLRRKFSGSPLEPITTLASTPVDNELLSKLQALIEENFSNPALNVDFIADHLGISRSGLYSKIRTLANVTPNELIQITRLKKAAELLAEGKYRVNEICYMVGFNSSSYFSRCFQKQFGEKPGEFAARHQ